MAEMQVFNSPAFPYATFNRKGEIMQNFFRVIVNEELDGLTQKDFAEKHWSKALGYIMEQFIAHGENNGHMRKITISIEMQ